MKKIGPSVPVDLVTKFVSTRTNDFMEVKLDWEEIEHPKFSRTGVCFNKNEIIEIENRVRNLLPEVRALTGAAHCYKYGKFGLNDFERDILLSDVEILKKLRDECVRAILPAYAEAVTIEEYAKFIYASNQRQESFIASMKEILSGRPEISQLHNMQLLLDKQVEVVLQVREKFKAIQKSNRRIPGAASVANNIGPNLDELKNCVWAALEESISRRIEAGLTAEDGKFDCKICVGNEITHVFPQCGHATCSVCLPFLDRCHMCRSSIAGAIRLYN
ncbi:unnamed protein product [Allacma fusca]|uniref:RING-type domain-containing protein n=1 Tax=Allacma fusca TaxID=39272 RepID=A0A8J2JVE5_9HEXA|nr:unnamed protein product [Allacma fusca]